MSDIYYDTVSKRWVIPGSDDKPRAYIPDSSVGIMAGFTSFVGTTPAIGVGSLGGNTLATMTGVKDVALGDRVIVNPKALMTLSLMGAHVPAANTINILLGNLKGAEATQPAVGWDVMVIKAE